VPSRTITPYPPAADGEPVGTARISLWRPWLTQLPGAGQLPCQVVLGEYPHVEIIEEIHREHGEIDTEAINTLFRDDDET
jgi:hypothetical protein